MDKLGAKPKPKVGDKLYSLNIGNAARGKRQILMPVFVTRVGRKYFYCNEEHGNRYSEKKYYLINWSQYSNYRESRLYATRQQWIDEGECAELCKNIRNFFQYGRDAIDLGVDKLRQISGIIYDV